jgi:hypothetical protein
MEIQLPEHINLNRPESYILTIQVLPQGFAFSIYNPVDDGSYFYYRPEKEGRPFSADDLKEMYFDNEFFSLPFRKVNILNNTGVFTYVPSLVFEEKDKAVYMDFLYPKPKGKLLHQPLPFIGATVIHAMDEGLYEFFHRSFPEAVYIHHTAPLLVYFNERIRTVNAGRMIVNLNQGGIDVLCFRHDTFELGNHFAINQIDDAVYYILFVWKQLKYDQMKDFIYIAGQSGGKKQLMDALKEYIHNIIPANIVPTAHFERVDTGSIPFELASLSLCEL